MAHRETGPHDHVAAVTGGANVRERSRSPPPAKPWAEPRTINVMGNELVVDLDLVSCPLCRLEFPSHRALCGHMNAHRNRGWRGLNPPPDMKSKDFTEYNDDEVEKEDNNAVPEGENVEVNTVAEDVVSEEPEVSTTTPVEVADKKMPLIPDLNKSPPLEDLEQE